MGRIQNKQSGFSVIELLLALIFLAIVVFIGVYVAHNHTSKAALTKTAADTAAKPAASDRPPATKPAPQVQYLKISEFGIKLPLTSEISDLSYTPSAPYNGTTYSVMLESGSKLGNLYHEIDPACDTAGQAQDLQGQILSVSAPGVNQHANATATVNGKSYYLFAKGGSAGCDPDGNFSPTAAQQAQIDAYLSAVYAAVNSAVAL
jgi:hypothetical protein